MVTTYPETTYEVAHARETSQLDDVRLAWIVQYRQNHPEADWWAEGLAGLEHSVETQERLFRMAEQLVVRGIDRHSVFATLRRADLEQGMSRWLPIQARHLYVHGRGVRNDDYRREPWSHLLPAATAGCNVIDALLGDHGTVVDLLPPEAFEGEPGPAEEWRHPSHSGRVLILIDESPRLDHLRTHGFDPITFDGSDPAAYAWAIFELASRLQAATDQLNCNCHPRFKPAPIGVAIDRSSAAPRIGRLVPS